MALTLGDKPKALKEQDVFRDWVWPVISALGHIPRGDLVHAEGTNQDLRAGIDWLVSGRDGTQNSIAVRVQGLHKRQGDWGTFSIRYRTERGAMSELTKRYRSVLAGGQYPTYTVQAYVERDGTLLNAYTVRTYDLYSHVIASITDDEHFTLCGCAVKHPKLAPGGAKYIPVAVTEWARTHWGTKGTPLGHGVDVRMTHERDIGNGLWGTDR